MKALLSRIFEISHSNHASIRSMEGLRGFAVLLVFLVHYSSLCGPLVSADTLTYQISRIIHDIGNAGVDLFFVLSGYLIYGMLISKQRPFISYLARRVQRIYPTFVAVFILYMALSAVFPAESKLPGNGSDALLYVLQNLLLLPGMLDITPIITVAWSLSYEFFFYLVTPLVIALLLLKQWPHQHRLALLLLISAAGFTYHWSYAGHIRLLMFVSGMMLYEVSYNLNLRPVKHLGGASLLLALVVIGIIPYFNVSGWFRIFTLFVLLFVLCWECFTVNGMTQRLFSWAPLRWYGNMSYSYYLIHGLTLKGLFLLIGGLLVGSQVKPWFYWATLLPAFLFTLLVSSALFITVEKPYSLARRRISDN